MTDQLRNRQTTNRPSFKQSRRGRAYYSAQQTASQKRQRVQTPLQTQAVQTPSSDSQDVSSLGNEKASGRNMRFSHTASRHMRWETWFIIGVVVLLVIILGCGLLIGFMRSHAALEQNQTTTVTQSARTSVKSGASDSNEQTSNSSTKNETSTQTPPAASLAWRDQEFAVDPSRTEWGNVDDDRKVVYLTFDDGPSAQTQNVLDILDRYGCKATFFVVGHNEDYYPMIAEAYKRGHTIGMHTYSHDYEQVYASDQAYFDDLAQIATVVKDQIGYIPAFIRFPGGSSNTISANFNEGIMSRLVDEVQAQGFQYFDWDLSFGDGSDHSAEELISYACEPIDKQKIVILCHDSAPKQTTVEALPAIIEHYQSLGYSFEALDRNVVPAHHGVSN